MSGTDDNRVLHTMGFLVGACVFSVLAYASWDQALDFDPCNNIFKPPAQKCVTSVSGPIAMGSFVIFIGGVIFHGLLKRGMEVLGSSPRVLLSAWMCLCAILIGVAPIFAVLTTDLPAAETDQVAQPST